MIIHDLNIFGTGFRPTKTKAKLIIDPDAILAGSVSFERLEAISRRNPEVVEPPRDLKLPQLSTGNRRDRPESPHGTAVRQGLGFGRFERDDHGRIITPRVIIVKGRPEMIFFQ
jgi:hypothetical protein